MAKIKKLYKKTGKDTKELIYPATITQAIKDGETGQNLHDYMNDVKPKFKFNATQTDGQLVEVGSIQLSQDGGKTWNDISPEFINNLRIQKYVATASALPSGQPVGTIYAVGPTYDAADTSQTNPIYTLYVYDGNQWVNNGKFTSIAAGVVQETGDSETQVMSQKATTEKLTELATEVGIDKLFTESDYSGVYFNSGTNSIQNSTSSFNGIIIPVNAGDTIELVGDIIHTSLFSDYPKGDCFVRLLDKSIKTIIIEDGEKYALITLYAPNSIHIKSGIKQQILSLNTSIDEINDKTNTLKDELDKQVSKLTNVSDIVDSCLSKTDGVDLSDAEQGFYDISASQLTFISSSGFLSKLISVSEGQVWVYEAVYGGSAGAIISLYDSNDNLVDYYDRGSTELYGLPKKGKIIIPANVTKMAFTTKVKDGGIYNLGLIVDYLSVSQLDKSVTDIKETINSFDDEFLEKISPNIWNGSVIDGYINGGTGKYDSSTSSSVNKSTDLIPVKPNTYYYLSGRNGDIKTIRCFSSDKRSFSKVLIASTGIARSSDYYLPNFDGTSSALNGQFKTPSDSAFVQISIGLNRGTWDKMMLEEIGTELIEDYIPSEYKPYNESKIIKPSKLPFNDKLHLKVLLIGSSHGMNTISQFPWIAHKSGIDIVVGNLFKGSLNLQQIASSITSGNSIGGWFKIYDDGAWVENESTLFNDIIAYKDWDYIILQRSASDDETWTAEQSAALDVIIEQIKRITTGNPTIVFNTGFADPDSSVSNQERISNAIIASAREMKEEYQIDIIPVATAIQNARNTSLGNLGNYYSSDSKKNQMCYDSQHLDYGIGCYVAGATLFEYLFRKNGKSVLTAKGYASYEEAKSFVGDVIDTGGEGAAYTEPTEETIKIAKYCAIAAVNDMDNFSDKLSEKYPRG